MTSEIQKSQVIQDQLADLTQTLEKEKVQLTPEVENYVREHVRAVQDKLQAGEDVHQSDLEFIENVKMWVSMPKEWREKYPSVENMIKSEESEEIKEANKRHISPKQWLDLLHYIEVTKEKKQDIDEIFKFPGGGKIVREGSIAFNQHSLKKLPKNLSIQNNLHLYHCTGLTELPEGLSVGGDLNLNGCTGLTELPKGLTVGGGLDLEGCTGLTELPEGLKVGGNLFLRGCTGLTKLPEGLSVGGNLCLFTNLHKQVKKDAKRLKAKGEIRGKMIIAYQKTNKQPVLSSVVNKIRNLFKSSLK